MMGRSLLIVGALGTIAVAVAGGLGYGLSSPADAGMPTHIVAALVAILLVMFAHSWILLYLLGTGRIIRDTVREGGLDAALLAESRRLRRVCYACLLAAAALVMATFLVGGAVAGKGDDAVGASSPGLGRGRRPGARPVDRVADPRRQRAPDGKRRPGSGGGVATRFRRFMIRLRTGGLRGGDE